MPDLTYSTSVYGKQGGSERVVASGGLMRVEEGGRVIFPVVAKTSDYTVLATDMSKIFTTRGAAGAVNFTLPAAAAVEAFDWVMFYNVANQNMTVTGTAGELIAFNDAAANSVALSTASEKIGGAFLCISDGTSWLVLPFLWETVAGMQTVTVTT
jgi:hypothetical protein